jgi:hypothetical protein
MQALQKQLLGYSTDLMNGQGPVTASGVNQINEGYSQMPNTVTRQLAGRGFGSSGKLGTALFNTENARLNAVSGFRAQSAQNGAGLADSLLNAGRGSSVTTPGNPTSDALLSGGNGLSNLSTLLMLTKVLGGNGQTNNVFGGYPSGLDSLRIPGGIPPLPGGGTFTPGPAPTVPPYPGKLPPGPAGPPPPNGSDWGGYG